LGAFVGKAASTADPDEKLVLIHALHVKATRSIEIKKLLIEQSDLLKRVIENAVLVGD